MQIDKDLLITWGAVAKKFKKNSHIFYEGDPARFYYQILEGKVRMCSYNEEGRTFIQGFFAESESFGEPPLFLNERYPACAIAETNCIILKLSKDTLIKLLEEYPELQMRFVTMFAKRIFEKATTNKNIVSLHPEQRILGFLKNFKKVNQNGNDRIFIPYTRQKIADLLGLRVETVIRTLIRMEEEGKVEIRHHKLYF
ncbi:MAG: Crp/Fnr family transcriptional regulator [Saprospiraceae bacterium]|jgi:CRP/FNR family transcriptional regulator